MNQIVLERIRIDALTSLFGFFQDPGLEQHVTHPEHNGSQENSDEPEGDQTTEDTGHHQQERQLRSLLDENRPYDIIDGPNEGCPDQQRSRPSKTTLPVEPTNRTGKH